jgi:hypothetical protein
MVDVSVVVGGGVVGAEVGGGGVGAVVGGAAIVVSGLYPPAVLVSDFVLAVSIGVFGADAGGGVFRAVSDGETRPVSGGAWPTPLSFWWLHAARAAAAASVSSNRIAKSLVRGFESWALECIRPEPVAV